MNIARGLLKNQLITPLFFFLKGETASLLLNLSNDHLCRFYYIKAPLQLIHVCQMLSELLTGAYCTPGQLEIRRRRDSLRHRSPPTLLNEPPLPVRQEELLAPGKEEAAYKSLVGPGKQRGKIAPPLHNKTDSDPGVRMSP